MKLSHFFPSFFKKVRTKEEIAVDVFTKNLSANLMQDKRALKQIAINPTWAAEKAAKAVGSDTQPLIKLPKEIS